VSGFGWTHCLQPPRARLARGDALGALNYIAVRDDPPALALRGIAMAQLRELTRKDIAFEARGAA
jgi:hypothetical protein